LFIFYKFILVVFDIFYTNETLTQKHLAILQGCKLLLVIFAVIIYA